MIDKDINFDIRNMRMEISFHFQKNISLKNRNRLKGFIGKLVKSEGYKPGNLLIVFCTDNYLLKINRDFLNHDYFTDIITFDYSAPDTNILIGEIYISVDRVKDNARKYEVSFTVELHRVIFHGILHLCGYRDKSEKDKIEMRKMENQYLGKYGL